MAARRNKQHRYTSDWLSVLKPSEISATAHPGAVSIDRLAVEVLAARATEEFLSIPSTGPMPHWGQ